MLRLFRLLGCGSCLPCGSSSSSQFPEPVQSSFLPADQSAKRAGLKLGPQFPRLALNPLEAGTKAGTKKKNRFLSQQQGWCGRRVPRPVRRGRRPWVTMPASLLRLLVPDSLARPPKRLDSFFLHRSHSDIFLLILVYLNTSINSGTYLATTVVLVAVIISAE